METKGKFTKINIKHYHPTCFTRFMSHFPDGLQNKVWDAQEYLYWYRWLPCLRCKRITRWQRCENCGKFFCERHAELADDELGEYGSVISEGGYPIHAGCLGGYPIHTDCL